MRCFVGTCCCVALPFCRVLSLTPLTCCFTHAASPLRCSLSFTPLDDFVPLLLISPSSSRRLVVLQCALPSRHVTSRLASSRMARGCTGCTRGALRLPKYERQGGPGPGTCNTAGRHWRDAGEFGAIGWRVRKCLHTHAAVYRTAAAVKKELVRGRGFEPGTNLCSGAIRRR